MSKNPASRSGFFGSHVFFGLAIVLTGISLALVGFGRSAHETMKSPRRLAAYQFATDAPGLRPPSPSSALSKQVTSPFVFTVTNTNDSGAGSKMRAPSQISTPKEDLNPQQESHADKKLLFLAAFF